MLPITSIKRVSFRLLAVIALSVSVAACGFHLRGNIPLSDNIKNMYVVAPKGDFRDELLDRLEKLGATVATDIEAADVILNVSKAKSTRSVGTLTQSGKVDSYNIRFNVVYSLLDLDGNPIREDTKINESRRYDFSPQQVVASEAEEDDLLQDMEEEVVLKMMRQLAAVVDYDPNAVQEQGTEASAKEQAEQ